MAVKNISIMEDVYKLLLSRKNENESFSEALRRELKRKKDIMEFAGAWKNIVSDNGAEDMKKKIEKLRNDSTKSLLKKYKR